MHVFLSSLSLSLYIAVFSVLSSWEYVEYLGTLSSYISGLLSFFFSFFTTAIGSLAIDGKYHGYTFRSLNLSSFPFLFGLSLFSFMIMHVDIYVYISSISFGDYIC